MDTLHGEVELNLYWTVRRKRDFKVQEIYNYIESNVFGISVFYDDVQESLK